MSLQWLIMFTVYTEPVEPTETKLYFQLAYAPGFNPCKPANPSRPHRRVRRVSILRRVIPYSTSPPSSSWIDYPASNSISGQAVEISDEAPKLAPPNEMATRFHVRDALAFSRATSAAAQHFHQRSRRPRPARAATYSLCPDAARAHQGQNVRLVSVFGEAPQLKKAAHWIHPLMAAALLLLLLKTTQYDSRKESCSLGSC